MNQTKCNSIALCSVRSSLRQQLLQVCLTRRHSLSLGVEGHALVVITDIGLNSYYNSPFANA